MLLCSLYVQSVLRGLGVYGGRQGAVAHARPTEGQVLFLARPTRSTLDGGMTDATWTSPSANCAFCDQLDETTDYLLCSCVFAREVWSRLLSAITSIATPLHPTSTLLDWWLSVRSVMP
jgi:hypothetical protein